MQPIEMLEYGSIDDVRLTVEQAIALRESGALTLDPMSSSGNVWRMTANHMVGIVRVDDLEIRIHPKMEIRHLLFLMSYAIDTANWKEIDAQFDSAGDLIAAIAHAFAFHADAALAQGVLQGYTHIEESLNVIRGRIRLDDQLRRRYGMLVPIEVAYDDFTVDIVENRLLKSATATLLGMKEVPTTLRRRLRRIDRKLQGVGRLPTIGQVRDVRIDRRNRRYSAAIELATLVLNTRSMRFGPGRVAGSAFLVNLNKLFECFLTTALMTAFSPYGGVLAGQSKTYLDISNELKLVPDLVWKLNGITKIVADIKYKSISDGPIPNADIYQALAYAIAHDLRKAHLLYAEGSRRERYEIKGVNRVIDVHHIDLTRGPEELLADIAHLADALVQGSARATPKAVA